MYIMEPLLIFLQLLDGAIVCRFCHLLRLAEQLPSSSPIEACCCFGVHQRLFSTGQHRWLVRVANRMGPNVSQFLCNLHRMQWSSNSHVLCFPCTSCSREQEARRKGEGSRAEGVSISPLVVSYALIISSALFSRSLWMDILIMLPALSACKSSRCLALDHVSGRSIIIYIKVC